MGANASSYPQSCPPHFGQQTFGTPLYTQQSSSWESKLYSLEPSGPERLHDRAKKRISGLATLKRRFIMRRKAGRSADHTRQMRELLAGWDAREVGALVEEYEGTAALKELSSAAALARPDAASLRRDMAALFQHKHCTDVDLVFQDTCFPAHRAILAARCPFFKTLLSSAASATSGCGGTEVLLDVGTAGMDVTMFSALLHFLYTGKLGTGTAGKDGEPEIQARTVEVLRQLSEEFGMPNPLEVDMRALYNYMCYYDSVLSFCSDPEAAESSGRLSGISGGGITGAAGAFAHADHPHSHGEDLRAHKAVLSARSPFFRNLLQRRIRTGEEMTERALQAPTLIVLDESIIPRKYARVILHCMYTDTVELSLVMRGSPSVGSLSEGQGFLTSSSSTRGAIPTHTEEAMELYHIALFLEFTMLAQGCEDIVAESISLDSLAAILKWSSQPYGSKWVHRQAMHFLCEEFSQVMTSDIFYELTKEHLLAAVQSDYLQASEQDILKYVIKWGEQQLIRRMAEREPNLLSGTAHSVQKRGVKRRDLDLEELREILSPLLPYVRIEHILPASGDVLADAMKRGLVSTPPSDMLPTAGGGKASVWLRLKNAGIYVRPRLFSPYVDEARSILEEMMVEQSDLVRLRMVRISNVPDTLYMVTNTVPQRCHLVNHQPITGSQSAAPSVVANEIPVPQLGVVRQMIGRLQELRLAEHVQRAYALNCGEGATVSSELQLRVLREFGLPDGAAELLQNPHKFFPEEHFGDKSPLLNLRPSGRCRVNSSPAVDSMLTDLDGFGVVHPPLPPLPPPYHPPATPGRGHLRGAWRRRVLVQPPSRSLSYPCNYTLLQGQTLSAAKHSSPAYSHSDCMGGRALSIGRAALPETHGTFEPLRRDFMPDIAIGMSALALSGDEGPDVPPRPHQNVTSSVPNCTSGPGPAARHCHSQTTCMRHLSIPNEPHPDFPDLYSQTFSNRLDGPAPGRPLQTSHKGPDIYSHARTAPCAHPSDPTHPASQGDGAASPAEPSYQEQRSDAVQASVGPSAGNAHPHGRCVDPDSALTCGLGASRHGAGGGGGGGGVGKEPSGGTAHLRSSTGDETTANQDQPSPSTDYTGTLHRKCAL